MFMFWKRKEEMILPVEKWFDEVMEQKRKYYSSEIQTLIPLSSLKQINEKIVSCHKKIKHLTFRNDHYDTVKEIDFADLKDELDKFAYYRETKEDIFFQKDFFQIEYDLKRDHYLIKLQDEEKEMIVAVGYEKQKSVTDYPKKTLLKQIESEIKNKTFKKKNLEEIEKYAKEKAEKLITSVLLKAKTLDGKIHWKSQKEEPWMSGLQFSLQELNKELDILMKKIEKKEKKLKKKRQEKQEEIQKEKERAVNHFREVFSKN